MGRENFDRDSITFQPLCVLEGYFSQGLHARSATCVYIVEDENIYSYYMYNMYLFIYTDVYILGFAFTRMIEKCTLHEHPLLLKSILG